MRSLLPYAVALAARLAAGLSVGSAGQPRGFDFYGFMAENLVRGEGLCWWFYEGLGLKYANRGPLYPLFLAGVTAAAGRHGVVAAVVAQSLVGTAALVVPAWLARRWAGDRAAAAALWIGALWPYSVVADTGQVEQVLYGPLCTLTLLLALRAADGRPRAAFGAGLAAGAAILARLTFLLSLPLLALATLRRRGIAVATVASAGVAVFLVPWMARNQQVVGSFVMGTDGGRALLVGNHPVTFTRYPAESIDEGEREIYRALPPDLMAELRGMAADEVGQDRRFREVAFATLAADPAGSFLRSFRKAAAQWSLVYNPGPTGPHKLAVFAASWAALLAAAAAATVVSARVRADLPAVLAVAASFTANTMVFWGQPRYIAPLHGIAIALAATWWVRRPERPA